MEFVKFSFLLTFLALCGVDHLTAKPHGCKVAHGEALQVDQGSKLVIQSGQKTVLEWDHFSIEKGEAVHFQQFDQNSVVLNRILGKTESSLLGSLQSNGSVYLINPQGIFIGPEGRIETASFVASTLDILDADFLQGVFLFSGDGMGAIVNLGTISCPSGNVALIARKVENKGTIDALNGSVVLASGLEILLAPEGEQRVFIRTGIEEEVQEGVAVEHEGMIQALQVEMRSGVNPYQKAIRSSGEVHANGVCEREGKIFLVADAGVCEVTGVVDASGDKKGGEIRLLGEEVRLLDGSEIDASGKSGGGKILVGGDVRGANREIKNAKRTFAYENASLRADAVENGDGGKIILWGDQYAHFAGSASVQGGAQGGDGGFIELSSPGEIALLGKVSAEAPRGKVGEFLLDPPDVTISSGATTGGTFTTTCTGSPPCSGGSFTPGATNPISINVTNLVNCLKCANVTIDTSTGSGGGAGSITIDFGADVSWNTATTLTLLASGDIRFNSTVTNTSSTPGFDACIASTTGVNATGSGLLTSAAITTNTGNILLLGNNSMDSSGGAGLRFESTPSVVTTSGNIQLAGKSSAANSDSSVGILFDVPNAIQSTSGNVTISGVSGDTGANAHGVNIANACPIGTTGTVTFGGSITAPIAGGSMQTISGCQGGAGSASHGINCIAAFTSSGDIVAIHLIEGGTGTGSSGFFSSANFASTGGGKIEITASTQATGASASHGIDITSTMSTTGSGSLQLLGTASSANSGSSNGVNLTGSAAVSTSSGTLSVGGAVPSGATGTGIGVLVGVTNAITSASGAINVSGTSLATGSGSDGVSATASWSVPTLNPFTFGSSITDGTVTISGCTGGSGSNSHGLSLASSFSTEDSITATNSIVGGSGTGSRGISFASSVTSTTLGAISLTASTNAGGGTAPIFLGGNITTTRGGVSTSGDIVLGNTVNIAAGGIGNISITGNVTGNWPFSLIEDSGTIAVSGTVDLSGTNGANFMAVAGSTATLSTINTSGTTNGGSVQISSQTGSVIVGNINSSGTAGTGGNITLQPSPSISGITEITPVGTLQLQGTSVNASGGSSGGAISLSATGRTTEPSVATIFGSNSLDNSLTFTGSQFTMGANEAMTVFGNITINMTGPVVVSDIVALNALNITGSSIQLNQRSAISLLSSAGTLYTSPSSHLLAGSTPVFSTAVTPSGSHTGLSGATSSLLVYAPASTILNFDTTAPTVAPTAATLSPVDIVYSFAVANAQLSDLLPLLGRYWVWPYHGLFCARKEAVCLDSNTFKFLTFQLENRLRE